MPLFYSVYSRSMSLYYTEMPKSKAQVHDTQSLIDEDKGQSSDLAAAKSKYEMLPHYLRSCLDYCCMLSTPLFLHKNVLIHLLIAENLIPEKSGEILEDIAASIIDELFVLGMIEETPYVCYDKIVVSEMYKKICLLKMEQHFVNETKNSPVYAVIIDDSPPESFKRFSMMQSLFVKGKINGAFFRTICTFQSMVVLDLWWAKVDYLPDEVGDLVNLRYLGLAGSEVKEIPSSIGNLQKLQTLNIGCIGLRQLPVEILNIRQLRHLLVIPGVRVPKGIGSLVDLHSWRGVHCRPDIASELSKLTQLRELGIHDVSVDYAEELFAAIMKMENLVSLSLTAEHFCDDVMDKGIYKGISLLPDLELFCPPPHLQDLHLDGGLVEIPKWLSSMENLTNLTLYDSNLLENPFSILQCIPKLKHLHLWNTYNARCIGKEFCDAGGFPSLEFLSIRLEHLVEWTEIVDGAFPNLRILAFYFCSRLMFLPEGLQYITTLENLYFKGLHGELMRKLKGKENYKIKHIPKVIELDSWSNSWSFISCTNY